MMRILSATLLATSSLLSAASGEFQSAASELSQKHSDAVVWISVTAKVSMSADGDVPDQLKAQLAGADRESTTETIGTFISKDGLIVTALAALDQSSMVDGQTVNTPMGAIKLNAQSEIKEIKVIMADGTEVPADMVLKDTDLGLGFIKLQMDSEEAKGIQITAIDLTDSSEGKLLDDCVILGRMDKSLQREVSVLTTEISGICTVPRRFYRLANDSIGSPVFLASGKLLGLSVIRKPVSELSSETKLFPVILPASDIQELSGQAEQAPVIDGNTENKESGSSE